MSRHDKPLPPTADCIAGIDGKIKFNFRVQHQVERWTVRDSLDRQTDEQIDKPERYRYRVKPGGAENARRENDGPSHRGWKMQDWNNTDQINQILVNTSIG